MTGPRYKGLPKEKRCPRCKEIKPAIMFNTRKRPYGITLRAWCLKCTKKYQAEKYKEQKEDIKKYMSTLYKYVNNLKRKSGCLYCDENDPVCLVFHHRNSEEKEMAISRAIASKWKLERLQKEINKCDILCANCHRKLHAYGNIKENSYDHN